MQPTWLIEADIFAEAANDFRTEVRRQGMPCHVVRYESVASQQTPVIGGSRLGRGECVIFRGSYPLMRHIQLHSGWVPAGWCAAERLACAAYYPHFEPFLLNRRHAIVSGVEAIRRRDELFGTFSSDGLLFVRPSGMQKLFTGTTTTREEFEHALAPARYDPQTRVVIAEPKQIRREWRLVIGGSQIVTGSQYLEDGDLAVMPGVPRPVSAFVNGMLTDVHWRPDELFMLDVCEADDRLFLLELNSFSCSGLYACDLPGVVSFASDLARGVLRDQADQAPADARQ